MNRVLIVLLAMACTKAPTEDTTVKSDPTTKKTPPPPPSGDCPSDLLAAVGSACSQDGKSCSGGSSMRLIMCSKGKWVEMAIAPPPNK
jgi:hypothetical protein